MTKYKTIAFILTVAITALIFFLPSNFITEHQINKMPNRIRVMSKNFTMMNYKILNEEKVVKKDNNKIEKKVNNPKKLDYIKNDEQTINKIKTTSDNKDNEKKELDSGEKRSVNNTIFYTPDFKIDKLPVYPEAAKRMKQEGKVIVTIVADKKGDIINVIASNSSGFPLLDEAAIRTVKEWHFSKLYLSDKINIIKTEIIFKLHVK